MTAKYRSQKIQDGFMQATEIGVSVQRGTKVSLYVKLIIKAKTVSNVFNELSKYKSDFSADTWTKITQAKASGSVSFFYGLFDISAGGSYDYENKETRQTIKDNVEAQRVAQALQDTEETEVTIVGTIQAEGVSYVPVEAYLFVHLTQVSINNKSSFSVTGDDTEGKAASKNGSQKMVTGEGNLNVIQAPSGTENEVDWNVLDPQGVIRAELHVVYGDN